MEIFGLNSMPIFLAVAQPTLPARTSTRSAPSGPATVPQVVAPEVTDRDVEASVLVGVCGDCGFGPATAGTLVDGDCACGEVAEEVDCSSLPHAANDAAAIAAMLTTGNHRPMIRR